MADSIEDRVGQQLGNYRLLRLLRRERTTDLYLGEHIFLKTQKAMNVLYGQLTQKELEEFLAQTRAIARLRHPNIPAILEFGVKDRTPFLVSDYTPDSFLAQLYPRGTRLPLDKIASYVQQVAAALHYIHSQGLVHGGVRPENILLGSQERIFLSGMMQEALGTTKPLTSEEDEALDYMAPELFSVSGRISPASDQYALGVVVYEWLSGDLPFHCSKGDFEQHALTPVLLKTKTPTVSPELAEVVARALAHDPQQRFADVNAFVSALLPLLQPVSLPGETKPNKEEKPPFTPESTSIFNKARPRIAAGAIGISLALLVLLLGVFLFPRQTAGVTPAQATQTAVVKSTRQAVATFTARSPQEVYTAVTRSNPAINDPLNAKSKTAWQTMQESEYNCDFNNGTYAILVTKANTYLNCRSNKGSFHNFAFQVEMSLKKGYTGGITFRANSDDSKFYNLNIVPGALCSFGLTINERGKDVQTTTLNENAQKFNVISVIAYENVFYFYINKKFVMQAQDSTLQSGAVGMYVLNSNDPVTEATFRNAMLWSL